MRSRAAVLGLIVSILAAARGGASDARAEKDKKSDDFAETALGGLSAGFGIVRVGGDAPEEALSLGGRVVTGPSNAVARILVDDDGQTAFGYRLEARPLSSTLPAILRVEIKALDTEDEKKLKSLAACLDCPPPRLVPSGALQFPPAQIVRDGDTMVIDLLVRPDTGEKIVDVVAFSTETVTREALGRVQDRVTRAAARAREGDALALRAAWEPAAAEYVKALALRPDAALHRRVAGCYLRLERLDLAQQQYEKATRLDPTIAESWHGLGVAQHRQGRFGKAIDAYQRALKIKPDWALARRNLASARLDRAETAAAFDEYRSAFRAAPGILETPDAAIVRARDAALQHYLFARVYAAEGRTDLALGALKRAKEAGFGDLQRVREDPEFKSLLADPRLAVLLGRAPRS